jgi:prevent-host-death family protein
VSTVGLRELRQDASDLVRRVEAGEEITINVAGRPSARLVAARPVPWRAWDEVADVFRGPGDPGWEHDRDLVDDDVRDPWAAR